MGRIRTIKPEFCNSPSVTRLSRDARLFFLCLLTEVDDDGRTRYQGKRLAGVLFPNDDDVTPDLIEKWVQECRESSMIVTYTYAGDRYLTVINFRRHQVVNKATHSKLPPHDLPDSVIDTVQVPEDYGSPTVDKNGHFEPKPPEKRLPEDYGSATVRLPSGMEQGTGNREFLTDAKASEPKNPGNAFAEVEEVLTIVAKKLKWTDPTPTDVRKFLRQDSHIRVLIQEGSIEDAAAIFLWAWDHWTTAPTWPSVFTQRNQLRDQMKGRVTGALNGKHSSEHYGATTPEELERMNR